MTVKAKNLKKRADPTKIPDGAYDGIWDGDIVRFNVRGDQYEAQTSNRLATTDGPCTVHVRGGQIWVVARP
jgi:endonuclease YncB( thermonuclease family)